MESNSLAEWYVPSNGPFGNNGGGEELSGIASVTPSSEMAHTGMFSVKLTITTPSSPESGARLFRWQEPRAFPELYYSAWYYFPAVHQVTLFWNVFQWKSGRLVDGQEVSDPVFTLGVGNLGDGAMAFGLFDNFTRTDYAQSPDTLRTIPVGRWIHIEAFYLCTDDNTGRVTIWQDGVQIFDVANVQTRYPQGDCRWSVNSTSDGLVPATATIFIDDVSIGLTRMGIPASQRIPGGGP